MYYLRNRFAKKSLEVLIPYRNTLGLRLGPQKDLGPCNVVLGAVAGVAGTIPARPAAVGGRERVDVGLGVAWARFLHSDGAERGPATAHGGAPERRPWWPAVRRGEAQGVAGRGTGRSRRLRGKSLGAGLH
jgi:hypothetical protein